MDFDGRKQLSQIKAPTLIINGTKDKFVPMKCTEELANGIYGAKLILVEEYHSFAKIKPELLAEHVSEFMEGIRDKVELKA